MSAETGLHFDYRRDGRTTGRLLVTDEGGRTVLLDQVNLDAEPKRTKVAEALQDLVQGLDNEVVLAELSQLAIDVPPETPRPDHSEVPGQGLALSDPEPWPKPVDGAALLDELVATFRRFLDLPEGAAETEALWSVHAHAHDTAEVSPILALTSPLPECGKTTNLEILSALVPRPLPTSNLTPATVFRAVDRFRPSLLVDEGDSFLRDDELRGILNSGHRRALAYVVRCVGDDHEPRLFSTWACKAIALIGKLPPTLRGRSIEIRMQRRKKGEAVEQLRRDRLHRLEPLRRKAWRWAQDHLDALRAADPDLPDGLHDRVADNWRPLLAIADLAGSGWPERAREVARSISGVTDTSEDSRAVLLLADLRELFQARDSGQLPTAKILEHLNGLEDRPWPEWRRGQRMSAVSLSRILRPFAIGPRDIWTGLRALKGYKREDFDDAWSRYMPSPPDVEPRGPRGSRNHAENPESLTRETHALLAGRRFAEDPHGSSTLAGLAGQAEEEDALYLADERAGMQEVVS